MVLVVRQALQTAIQSLEHSASAQLDAEILLAHLLQQSRATLYAWPERLLDQQQAAQYFALIRRRSQGEPVAYIIGKQAFWTLELAVNPAVLIPRAATEHLVAAALELGDNYNIARVLDLGTGSGCIALSLACVRPEWQITAVDNSAAALQVARGNAARIGINNINWLESDWFAELGGQQFDLIISNPPYIAADDPHLQQADLQYEPQAALVSGVDGLADIRKIIAAATDHLHSQGVLLLEVGYNQADQVKALLSTHGYQHVSSIADLQGHARVCLGYVS